MILTAPTPSNEARRIVDLFEGYNDTSRRVTYDQILNNGDAEYLDWRYVGRDITFESNAQTAIIEWYKSKSISELAAILATVPTGLSAHPDTGIGITATPFQRLTAYIFAHWPVDLRCKMELDSEQIRSMAYNPNDEGPFRKIPIRSSKQIDAGEPPDVSIIDLPPAAGKTMWSLMAAFLLVHRKGFDYMLATLALKNTGVVYDGSAGLARVVLVATAPSTFDHFVTTVRRLIPKLEACDASLQYQVWTGVKKEYTLLRALACYNDTLIFWIVPIDRLNQVRRASPEVSVPVCVTDEFIVNPPTEKGLVTQSTVVKHIVLQATPQALSSATSRGRSFLKDHFQGQIIAPNMIRHLVRRRDFTTAQRAMNQACILELSTVTAFRRLIMDDLRHLVPPGIEVFTRTSRRVTLASHLFSSNVDLVPLSLYNIVGQKLQPARVDTRSSQSLEHFFSNENIVDPAKLVELLGTMTFESNPENGKKVVQKLVERISEFKTECPICTCEPEDTRMCSHCGHCVCEPCFHRILFNSGACPFCRTDFEVHEQIDVDAVEEVQTSTSQLVQDINEMPQERFPVTFFGALNMFVAPSRTQKDNLMATLAILKRFEYKRSLIFVQMTEYSDLDSFISAEGISDLTGVQVSRVDDLVRRGQGSRFTRVKRDFDSPSPAPMGLLCYGDDPTFLVGTDLVTTDSIVVVGNVPESLVTQTVGRAFRPCASRARRDNSRDIMMIRINVG